MKEGGRVAETKNLFLRDKKESCHLLVSVGYDVSVDIKALGELLGVSKLSFGSAERLMSYLGVEPGSVTLLALANDAARRVRCVVNRAVWSADFVLCHPLVNTATLKISHAGIEAFLDATGHAVEVVDVPSRSTTAVSIPAA
jgi:Ala-tRNA(Pro) deacylase